MWEKPLSHGLRSAAEPESQHPGPSSGGRAFIEEKADVMRAEELIMWEKRLLGGLKGLFGQPPV